MKGVVIGRGSSDQRVSQDHARPFCARHKLSEPAIKFHTQGSQREMQMLMNIYLFRCKISTRVTTIRNQIDTGVRSSGHLRLGDFKGPSTPRQLDNLKLSRDLSVLFYD